MPSWLLRRARRNLPSRMEVGSPVSRHDLMPTASSMTFTEITRAADQIRGRWHFNWLEPDPPSWSWPAKETTRPKETA